MALLTKKAILSTFEEMLVEMPFDKITVSALVKRSGISSNTFYYHYQDIYALLDNWLEYTIGEIRKESHADNDWTVELKAILQACQNHSKIVNHIIKSLSREQMEQYVFEVTEDSFTKFVRLRTGEQHLSESQISEIAEFCRFLFIGLFLKFSWDGMKGDVNEGVDRIAVLVDAFVDSASNVL